MRYPTLAKALGEREPNAGSIVGGGCAGLLDGAHLLCGLSELVSRFDVRDTITDDDRSGASRGQQDHSQTTLSPIAAAQLGGYGTIISFDVAGGAAAADSVCQNTRLIRHATSLGAVDTTMERRSEERRVGKEGRTRGSE